MQNLDENLKIDSVNLTQIFAWMKTLICFMYNIFPHSDRLMCPEPMS